MIGWLQHNEFSDFRRYTYASIATTVLVVIMIIVMVDFMHLPGIIVAGVIAAVSFLFRYGVMFLLKVMKERSK